MLRFISLPGPFQRPTAGDREHIFDRPSTTRRHADRRKEGEGGGKARRSCFLKSGIGSDAAKGEERELSTYESCCQTGPHLLRNLLLSLTSVQSCLQQKQIVFLSPNKAYANGEHCSFWISWINEREIWIKGHSFSLHVIRSLSLALCMYVFMCLHIHTFIRTYLSIYPSISLSAYLFICHYIYI